MNQCRLSDLFPLQCYECDGVKGGGGLCPGNAPWGERQVDCGEQYCGLLLEERLTYNKYRSTVVSSVSRWRRGCTTDGHEMTDNSEASNAAYRAEQGCKQVAQRDQDLTVIVGIIIIIIPIIIIPR